MQRFISSRAPQSTSNVRRRMLLDQQSHGPVHLVPLGVVADPIVAERAVVHRPQMEPGAFDSSCAGRKRIRSRHRRNHRPQSTPTTATRTVRQSDGMTLENPVQLVGSWPVQSTRPIALAKKTGHPVPRPSATHRSPQTQSTVPLATQSGVQSMWPVRLAMRLAIQSRCPDRVTPVPAPSSSWA